MDMNIYKKDDYRVILSEIITEKKFLDKKYSFQSMSNFIRVQKSYLSKVISGNADLNSDQLYMCCIFLELNNEETEYLLLLLEKEKCTFPERIKVLVKKIESIQDSKRDIKNILLDKIKSMDAVTFDNSIHVEYYLDPIIQIVHMFLIIPRFNKNINSIAEELFLSKEHLNDILKKLVEMNIIEIHNDKVNVLIKSMHLPRESKIVSSHQQLMKQYALHRLSRIPVEKKKTFSVTFTSNDIARKKIENEFNDFLLKVRKISQEGDARDCYQMTFDLFSWSNS
jgi:uncharacterized protein (TIGR02147 family)